MAVEDNDDPEIKKALKDLEKAESDLEHAQSEEERAELEIKRATHELERAEQHRHHPNEYPYTVDGIEYKTDAKSLTGSQIKSKVPNINLAYQLVEESRNEEQDRVISDTDTVNIDIKPAPAFYLVPPATFG